MTEERYHTLLDLTPIQADKTSPLTRYVESMETTIRAIEMELGVIVRWMKDTTLVRTDFATKVLNKLTQVLPDGPQFVIPKGSSWENEQNKALDRWRDRVIEVNIQYRFACWEMRPATLEAKVGALLNSTWEQFEEILEDFDDILDIEADLKHALCGDIANSYASHRMNLDAELEELRYLLRPPREPADAIVTTPSNRSKITGRAWIELQLRTGKNPKWADFPERLRDSRISTPESFRETKRRIRRKLEEE